MSNLPIRMAVRVDFADGSQHEYEVRTSDAVPAVGGFFPEGVVTADTAARMRYDLEHQRQMKALRQVRDLHNPEPGQHPDFCGACLHEMPCPTRRILDGVHDD